MNEIGNRYVDPNFADFGNFFEALLKGDAGILDLPTLIIIVIFGIMMLAIKEEE